MMIDSTLLAKVMDLVAGNAYALADVILTNLRKTFPGVHFSVCCDDDIPARARPAAGNPFCRLYYVDSGDHCLRLTPDAQAATGLVVALKDWDES